MKVIALTLTTLCLAAAAQAQLDYQLQCTREEIGIRWPSYHNNNDYYVCHRVGDKAIQLSCRTGELFTFVLQTCTLPSQFIPPPPMNILPISTLSTGPVHMVPGAGEVIQLHPGIDLPKPIYPMQPSPPILGPNKPQIAIDQHRPTWVMPIPEPPYPTDFEESYPELIEEAVEEPMKPSQPVKPMPHLPLKPMQQAPLPPTPAPTPPTQPPKKMPQLPNKKPAAVQAATGKKQPPKPSGVRKPMPPKPTKT